MRILFVYTNVNGFHTDVYSIGLASLMSSVRKAGHEIRLVIVREKSEYSLCYEAVKSFEPAVVGFTAVSSQFGIVKEIARGVKAIAPSVFTVCGGIHPTIFPDCLFEAPFLDGAFIGESELAFPEFLERMEREESFLDSDNFAYVKNDQLIRNSLKPLIESLDSLPFPDKTIYPYGESIRASGYAPFLFSRGCPFNCTYCSNHAIGKLYGLSRNAPRYRSPESSICEIEETLAAYPFIKLVGIGDDILGLNPAWREEFLTKYRDRVKIPFFCLQRANVVSETSMKQLKEAGCKQISFGVESGNDHVRNVIMNRDLDEASIIRAFGLAHAYGIKTNAINIIGVPGETSDMIWDTIRLNRKLKPTTSGVNIYYPYKGTILGNECFKKGLVDDKEYESFTFERRKTILKFPEEHRGKIDYFYKNWDVLVFPYSLKKRIIHFIYGTPVWTFLHTTKQCAVKVWDMVGAFSRR